MTEPAVRPQAPIRTCAGCGRKAHREELVRIVQGSPATLVVDIRKRMPGRGVWLHSNKDCVKAARASGRLLRSLRIFGSDSVNWASVEDFFTA